MNNVVGPGAVKIEEAAPKPTLDKASEFEYVEILNPLTDDFMVQVAQDVPVNVPFEVRHDETGRVQYLTTNEAEVRTNYGLNLKNADHNAKKQIFNNTIIPAGKSKVFRGSEAQVAIRQLVNEILQRKGKKSKLLMSNPTLRVEVEKDIIIRRGNVQELLDTNFQSERQQVEQALTKENEASNEFPGLDRSTEPAGTSGDTRQKAEAEPDTGKATDKKDGAGKPDKLQRDNTKKSPKKD